MPAGDELLEVPSDAPSPEEGAALHDLADHLLSTLPVEQRRVVMLHEVVGLTYREIAALEGISKSEAHDRHRTGMRALAAAAYRDDDRHRSGFALLPIALADLAGGADEGGAAPPREVYEGAWQRAAADLGGRHPSPAWTRSPERAVHDGSSAPCLARGGRGSAGWRPRSWRCSGASRRALCCNAARILARAGSSVTIFRTHRKRSRTPGSCGALPP